MIKALRSPAVKKGMQPCLTRHVQNLSYVIKPFPSFQQKCLLIAKNARAASTESPKQPSPRAQRLPAEDTPTGHHQETLPCPLSAPPWGGTRPAEGTARVPAPAPGNPADQPCWSRNTLEVAEAP